MANLTKKNINSQCQSSSIEIHSVNVFLVLWQKYTRSLKVWTRLSSAYKAYAIDVIMDVCVKFCLVTHTVRKSRNISGQNRSALKSGPGIPKFFTIPVQDFNSFPIMFYYIISTTYQKIGDLFCPVHNSGLSHSV